MCNETNIEKIRGYFVVPWSVIGAAKTGRHQRQNGRGTTGHYWHPRWSGANFDVQKLTDQGLSTTARKVLALALGSPRGVRLRSSRWWKNRPLESAQELQDDSK